MPHDFHLPQLATKGQRGQQSKIPQVCCPRVAVVSWDSSPRGKLRLNVSTPQSAAMRWQLSH